jgi:hypothetical protein
MTPSFVTNLGAPKPDVRLFHAGGREVEIEEIFRRVLAGGVALDQVEFACASDAHFADKPYVTSAAGTT